MHLSERCKQEVESIHETVQKPLNDLDNHYGVITHLGPDVLECQVKWALGSITMNKASGGDGIPVELFQILKDFCHTAKQISHTCVCVCTPSLSSFPPTYPHPTP